MKNEELSEKLFDLTGYLLTSAQCLMNEPQEYGPFRLLEGASRVCAILENEDAPLGEFFKELQAKIDSGKFLLMTDTDAFTACIDESVSSFVKESRRISDQ